MTGAVVVTGHTQREAWQRRELPPPEEVRPDLWSVAVPIPNNPLRYTLSYAFLADAGVVLVDPGWDTDEGRQALADGLGAAGAKVSDVVGVVVTHVHPDHHGLSGFVRETAGAWIAMHPAEFETLPTRIWQGHRREADHRWLQSHGVPEGDADMLAVDPSELAEELALVEPDRLLSDGDLLPAVGRAVRAIWTPGHTPGHLCLHDADAGVLLTGDHLLPRITPNIGVQGHEVADPLTEYLDSLRRIGEFHADEALPAHEYRFRGVDARADEIAAHHGERSAEVLAAVDRLPEPTTWAVAAELTWSRGWPALHGFLRRMALGETLAHLRHLAARGVLADPTGDPLLWRRP